MASLQGGFDPREADEGLKQLKNRATAQESEAVRQAKETIEIFFGDTKVGTPRFVALFDLMDSWEPKRLPRGADPDIWRIVVEDRIRSRISSVPDYYKAFTIACKLHKELIDTVATNPHDREDLVTKFLHGILGQILEKDV